MSLFPRRTARGPAPFVSIPIGLVDHPEIIDLGDAFALAVVRAFDYCAAHRSDGVLPASIVRRIFGSDEVNAINVGVIARSGKSFVLNGFLDTNIRASQRRDSSADSSTDSPTVSQTGCKEKEKKKKKKKDKEKPISADPSGGGNCESPTETLARWEREYAALVAEGKTLPPQQLVWQRYFRRYVARHGDAPTEHTRHFVAIALLLKRHTPDAITARLDRYFGSSVPFACREGARDFDRFVKFFDQLAPVLDARDDDPPEPLPAAGPIAPQTQAMIDEFLGRKAVTA